MLDSVAGKLKEITGAVGSAVTQKAEAAQAVVTKEAEAAKAVVTKEAEAAKAAVTKEAEAAKAAATEKAAAAKAAVTEKVHEAKAAVDKAKTVVREKTEPARQVPHKVDEKIAADPHLSTAVRIAQDVAAVGSFVLDPAMGAGYQAASGIVSSVEKAAEKPVKGEADPATAKAYGAMHPMALEAGATYLHEKAKGASSSEATLAAVERAVEVAPFAAAERQFEKAGSEYERGNYHAAVAEAAKGAAGFVAEVVEIASVIDMSAGGLEAAEAAKAAIKEAPKVEAPKVEAPKDAPKADAPKADAPKADAPKADAPKADAPKADAPKADAPKAEAPKADAPPTEALKTEAPKTEAPVKTEGPATEAPKAQAPAPEPPKAQGASADQPQGSRAAESGPGGGGGGNKAGGGGDGGGGENGRARAQEILNEFAEAQQKASPQAKAADILEQPGARVAGPEPGAQDAWSSGDTSPEPGRWPARPLDDPVFRAEMEGARAAYEGIPDRSTGLPRPEAVKAAARTESGRTWTESGYTDRPNYTGAAENTDRAMVEGAQAGRGPAEHPFDKQAGPAGEGQTRASHAEQQAAIEAPDEPLGVNRVMCPDCVEFFQARAIDRETPQFVADPQGVHIFMPSGQHFLERY